VRAGQRKNQKVVESWQERYKLSWKADRAWYRNNALVVASGEEEKKAVLEAYHDSLTAGHLGVAKTLLAVCQNYWWPGMRVFIQSYVRGCMKCQENKTKTHPNKPPLQPILPDPQARPFSTITMDFVVKLPTSQGYNSILTIMDHDCTKAVILLPCREDMNSFEVAKLYLKNVFPFVGLPEKVISDRDTKFTSKVFNEICSLLKVKQSMASAYHLQTDGQSEKTNQHVETALHIFGNFQQSDWSDLLPIIQYQLNSRISHVTKQIPYETWMGFLPRAHQPKRESTVPAVAERKQRLQEAWQHAIAAIAQAQSLWQKPSKYRPYRKGDKVWLEGTHLHTSHPMHKLRPKQFSPFEVTEELSSVMYCLDLPPNWRIYNAFHASLLSPHHEMNEYGKSYPTPAPELIDGEPEWEVAEVLASRQHKCQHKLQYLINWVGYPASENSWEPVENVRASDRVREFHQRHPTAIKAIKTSKVKACSCESDSHQWLPLPAAFPTLCPSS
jgi:hypothetical protein